MAVIFIFLYVRIATRNLKQSGLIYAELDCWNNRLVTKRNLGFLLKMQQSYLTASISNINLIINVIINSTKYYY